MKSLKKLPSVILIMVGIVIISDSFALEPLSCKMRMMLTGLTAMQRDKGISRKNVTTANTKDSDLKRQEIKTILDRVYIEGKGQTVDEISNDVFEKCKRGG